MRRRFRVYWKALAPDGFLVVHISSRRLALAPVVARLANELGLSGEWKPLGGDPDGEAGPLWTDDFSSILSVVRWR